MALVPLTDVCRIRVNGICDGQAVLNILDYRVYKSGGGSPGTSVNEVVNLFRAVWRTDLLPLISSAYTVIDYTVTQIVGRTKTPPAVGPANFVYGERDQLVGVPGTDVGGAAGSDYPTFVTVSGVKRTLKAGREQIGGIRISPVLETVATENTLTSTALTNFDAAFSFLESIPGTGIGDVIQLVVFHQAGYLGRKADHVLSPSDKPTDHTDDVVSLKTRKYVGSQVSRKRRRLIGQ